MKKKIMLFVLTAMIMASCTNEMGELFAGDSPKSASEALLTTRSCSSDTVDLGELVCLEDTGEIPALRRLYEEMGTGRAKVQAASAMDDEFFTSNIYAIREMPITIKVRSVASGSNAAYSYLYCSGAGKEVVLNSTSSMSGSKFYLKIPSSISGIPYLIYSNVSKTPLTIGYYNKTPNVKILMSQENDSKLSDYASWDLSASSANKGYFSIQNEFYIGQADPNDMWSLFNYTLEAIANNKLGFARPVANRGQQEFLITTINSFSLQNVTFDLDHATMTAGTPLSVEAVKTNAREESQTEQFDMVLTSNETSYFSETAGKLKLNISKSNTVKFPRPIPVAGKVVILENSVKDAVYSSSTQKISKTVTYKVSIEMKPRSLLKLTAKFRTFNISVPYVAVAKYQDREVKVKGTWRGLAIANPEYYAPICEPRFYDMDSGELMGYTMSFDAKRNKYVVK